MCEIVSSKFLKILQTVLIPKSQTTFNVWFKKQGIRPGYATVKSTQVRKHVFTWWDPGEETLSFVNQVIDGSNLILHQSKLLLLAVYPHLVVPDKATGQFTLYYSRGGLVLLSCQFSGKIKWKLGTFLRGMYRVESGF